MNDFVPERIKALDEAKEDHYRMSIYSKKAHEKNAAVKTCLTAVTKIDGKWITYCGTHNYDEVFNDYWDAFNARIDHELDVFESSQHA